MLTSKRLIIVANPPWIKSAESRKSQVIEEYGSKAFHIAITASFFLGFAKYTFRTCKASIQYSAFGRAKSLLWTDVSNLE